ncbi:MAG TPA: shikimate dehydrogenase [Bacillota bacterium]|nr:shikimate dehydrogenase [Bacillota bacterium]
MASGISGKTKVCGIIGYPVEHSFSPAMHNAAFRALGLDYVYIPFPVKPCDLGTATEAVRVFGLVGVNVTIPHKEAVIPFLDELSEEAGILGAVNTVVNRRGRLLGCNTDGRGFIRSLRENAGFDPAGKKALVLGAGGAARAVAVQLALSGVSRIVLTNRSKKRAEDLARLVSGRTGVFAEVAPWPAGEGSILPPEIVRDIDLIVQTTSLGMYPGSSETVPFPFTALRPGQLVCDLVYNPAETLFLRKSRLAGAQTVDGLGMLLYQGALSFELWTALAAPLEVMKEVLYNTIAGGKKC